MWTVACAARRLFFDAEEALQRLAAAAAAAVASRMRCSGSLLIGEMGLGWGVALLGASTYFY